VELAPATEPAAAAEPAVVELEPEPAPIDLGEDVTLFETANAALPEETVAGKGEVPISFETKTIGGGEQQFNGKPLSLDFKDADIKDIFRFISDFSGLNVVLDPTVSGKITIKLTEVPWDQALDIILKNNGLGMVFENNVIRIATTQKLATEEANRRRLAEEKELAVPLKTITRALSYAKAQELQKILEKVMTKRGEVIVDKRTNTLILSDVPDRFDMIQNLIETLDAPTPQVAIEARIVETVRDFAHELGIQWGFLGVSDAAHGNTTDLIFPNNARVDGTQAGAGGIPGSLGGYAVNLPSNQRNSGIGLSFGNVLDTFRLDIALSAFEREGKGRVISAPKVTTQNNTEAEIKSGKQIPVTTIANNTVTTNFVDALLSLKVKPQITAEGTVILDITVDKSAPDFANVVFGTPPIDKRQATTSVLVRDGGTTVIGGIFQVTDQNGQSRTPFLHKIPILGNLFKNKIQTRFNNELLIFVTPRIVKY
jgi:type IV pilus assembly protein PilQ